MFTKHYLDDKMCHSSQLLAQNLGSLHNDDTGALDRLTGQGGQMPSELLRTWVIKSPCFAQVGYSSIHAKHRRLYSKMDHAMYILLQH